MITDTDTGVLKNIAANLDWLHLRVVYNGLQWKSTAVLIILGLHWKWFQSNDGQANRKSFNLKMSSDLPDTAGRNVKQIFEG